MTQSCDCPSVGQTIVKVVLRLLDTPNELLVRSQALKHCSSIGDRPQSSILSLDYAYSLVDNNRSNSSFTRFCKCLFPAVDKDAFTTAMRFANSCPFLTVEEGGADASFTDKVSVEHASL